MIEFDDFALDLPSVGNVLFRDLRKHPQLRAASLDFTNKFVEYGRQDREFDVCSSVTEEEEEIYKRQRNKWKNKNLPTQAEIAQTRVAAKQEAQDLRQQRKQDFENIVFLLTHSHQHIGVLALSDVHVMRTRQGVRELQSQNVLMADLSSPDLFDDYVLCQYDLWKELLDVELEVTPGIPVVFKRWYVPNKKRTNQIVRMIHQVITARDDFDLVGWPQDQDETDLGITRVKFATLKRGQGQGQGRGQGPR